MLNVLRDWQPDHLTFLGDLDDMEAPSRFASGTKEEVTQRVADTSVAVNKFLYTVRGILPNARIDWHMGNHEHRLLDYVSKQAKALEGFVTYELLYPLRELNIRYYDYNVAPVKVYGDFHVTHGSLISQHAGESGRKEHEKYGISGFSGHTHRLGVYNKTNMAGEYTWIECGHLADVNQAGYTVEPNWQSGFATAYVDRGKVFPSIHQFVGNAVMLEGKKYS